MAATDETATDPALRRASFHAMVDGTAEDWGIISHHAIESFVGLPERVLAHLRLLDDDHGGFAVDRLTHSLQTATRAERAGRDDEYVFCALVHDIGDTLGPANHADIAAAIIEPFVSEEHHWMVQHHAIFQGYYYFHHLGMDRDLRDRYADHPCYELTAEFCHEFDQPAFDPDYDTHPLDHFEPLVRAQLATTKRSLYRL